MRIARTLEVCTLLLAAAADLHAAPLPPEARAEVAALFERLQTSGCQFHRNGTWHSSTEAQGHLARKLDYLERKDLVKTAEDFIRLGAASSSISGRPYLVKCGASAAPMESQAWLLQQLAVVRRAK